MCMTETTPAQAHDLTDQMLIAQVGRREPEAFQVLYERHRDAIFRCARRFTSTREDGPAREENTATCIAQCLSRPAWKLSLQTHKITGIR